MEERPDGRGGGHAGLGAEGADAGDEVVLGLDVGERLVGEAPGGDLGVGVTGGVGRAHDGRVRGAVAELVPDLLRDEGHVGVEEAQDFAVDVREDGHHLAAARLVGGVEVGLGVFEVPVAEVGPGEVVDGEGAVLDAVFGERGVERGAGVVGLEEEVAVVVAQERGVEGRRTVGVVGEGEAWELLGVHLQEARGVPELGAEVAADLELAHVHLRVGLHRGDEGEGEAEGVGGVAVDDLQRVKGVAEALGHLAALGVAHDAVEDDVPEGRLAHEVVAGHDHARHPEEEDVGAGDEVVRRVIEGQILGPLGPAQRRERPEPRGEPRVQHVRILREVGRAALRATVGLGGGGPFVAARPAGVDGDAVAPPDLAADAPIADVLHPVEIDALPAFGLDGDLALAHRLDGRLGEGPHPHEPLLRQAAVHHRVATVAVADLVLVVLDLDEVAALLKVFHDGLAAREAIHPLVTRAGVHRAVVVHHVHLRQVVPLPHREVVRVVRRGDLHHARAEILLHVIVEDHRDLPVRQRQEHLLPPQMRVTPVRGVDRHRRVAGERLRARRRHRDELPLAPHHRVAHIPQMAGVGLVLHLVVGQGRAAPRAPVHDVVAAVDQPLVVEVAEDLGDGRREPLVHREALAPPVRGVAEHPLLVDDCAAVLPLPLPHAVDERLAPQILPPLPLLAQGLFHHVLRGDARVVGARHPADVVAAHPVPAHQHVLDGLVQCVAHVEDARDVRRRDHHCVRPAPARGLVVEAAVPLPPRIPLRLNRLRIVMSVHHRKVLVKNAR